LKIAYYVSTVSGNPLFLVNSFFGAAAAWFQDALVMETLAVGLGDHTSTW
jgi:hypothetical protein